MDCDVIFHALIPMNIQSCPYMLFVSHGYHQHPPPPPTKPPQEIMKGILQLISDMRNPNMTLGIKRF